MSEMAILGISVAIGVWIVFYISTSIVKRQLRKAFKKNNVDNFLLLWRSVWCILATIFIAIGFSGSFAALGISLGFLSMILGSSLQAPVTGIAAWLMIILKRPFKIGDRIIISNVTGDVVDINLTHIILNQVGGTVFGEEKSGRGVLIPNATLFNQIIYNYTLQSKFILDEIVPTITFDSDVDTAEKILLDAAINETEKIIKETKKEPYIREEIADSGIRVRLRYQTLPMERQKISGKIVKKVIQDINKTKKVKFCYPHTQIVYNK